MTERRRRQTRALTVPASAIVTFLALLALLSFQLRSGHDPVLGAARQTAALTAGHGSGRSIVTRSSGGGGSAPAQSAPAAQQGHAPVVTHASGSGGGDDG